MANWKDEYMVSLKGTEMNNPVNMELVQTCSQMADRISSLEAEKTNLEAHLAKEAASKQPQSSSRPDKPPALDDPGALQVKLDLAEALRSKGVAEARLRAAEEELIKLRSKSKEDSRSIRHLTSDKTVLTTRLKDREHELREKRKLLENVQDEMITLNLQMSLAEKERDKVKKENRELIDRWMKRMGQEADAMNLANEPHLESPQ